MNGPFMVGREHIDDILREWDYDPYGVNARIVECDDGREVIQMRLDMGLLQLEIDGRPDGTRPAGKETYLDYLVGETIRESGKFRLNEEQCAEADREFVQFYHRRICWLKLNRFESAVRDADHTLGLMDFCRDHSPDEHWTMSHEQYRRFVLFHRTQAAALAALNDGNGPEAAVHELNEGLKWMQELWKEFEDESGENDELVQRLKELREELRDKFEVGRTLQEQLAEAIATEQYELAARLRDELDRRSP